MKFILILLINFTIINCYSQNYNKGIVYYGQFQSLRMGARNDNDRLSTLIFNKNESSYVTLKDSLDKLNINLDKNAYSVSSKTGTVYGGDGKQPFPYSKSGDQVYTNLGKDTVWSCFQRGTFHYCKEKRKQIDWKLTNESKKIGIFKCFKAIGTFRGRDYTAWYTNEIPLPYGPWKLQGLPGLILEAYNSNEEIYYYAKKVEYPTQNPTQIYKIKKSKDEKWLSYPEYLKRLEELVQKDDEQMILLKIKYLKVSAQEQFKEISE